MEVHSEPLTLRQAVFSVGAGRDIGNREDETAGTETHYSWEEIPWFPARTPKLLSQRVYSAPLVLDASAPSEPGGTWWALGRTG